MSKCELCTFYGECKYRDEFTTFEKQLDDLIPKMNELIETIPSFVELQHYPVCKYYILRVDNPSVLD